MSKSFEEKIFQSPEDRVADAYEAGKQVVIQGDPKADISKMLSAPHEYANVINTIPLTPVSGYEDFLECARISVGKVGHTLSDESLAVYIKALNSGLGQRQFSIVFYNNGENMAVQLSVSQI